MERPNILLIMTDQQRGDCLGIEGHPVLQTPNLDHLAATGVRFSRAYSACPVCVPARRTLLTGQKPSSHGVFNNHDTLLEGPTLPGELSKAGYQTHLVGKLHMYPKRKLYGFHSSDWADSATPIPSMSDYDRFLVREGVHIPYAGVAHGISDNGVAVRPFHLDEKYHFTNWCTSRAIEFIDRRDPTVPFFLTVSYHQPHPPLTPPKVYYDRYMNMELPEPYVGDWARVFDGPQRGLGVGSWRSAVDPAVMKQFRAAYYGCINHIDDQIGLLLRTVPSNTVILFCSDHGEMLGDHQWTRKRNAFEPSARVPFIINFPKKANLEQGSVREEPVELMDVMPTLLDIAGVAIPESVDGKSVLPLLNGESSWRDYVHGEISNIATLNSGMQYLTNGKRKYIWYPGTGVEHYFDLTNDPREMTNQADNPEYQDEMAYWRRTLVTELSGRPEGFTDGIVLKVLGGPTKSCLPEFENRGR
jgi:choline-sulfatase